MTSSITLGPRSQRASLGLLPVESWYWLEFDFVVSGVIEVGHPKGRPCRPQTADCTNRADSADCPNPADHADCKCCRLQTVQTLQTAQTLQTMQTVDCTNPTDPVDRANWVLFLLFLFLHLLLIRICFGSGLFVKHRLRLLGMGLLTCYRLCKGNSI